MQCDMHVIECANCMRKMTCEVYLSTVLTLVSVVTEPGHSLSPVYNHVQGVSGNHALTLDIHICSHNMASNMKPMVDSRLEQQSTFAPVSMVSPLRSSAKQLSLGIAGGDVLRHVGSKTESCVYDSCKFVVSYDFAPVVRPILSVDVLANKLAQVVYGVGLTRENGAMVLNAALVKKRHEKV